MERLETSVTEQELKKGIEEDGADRNEAEVLEEDLAEWNDSLWPSDSCEFIFWVDILKDIVN